eukprot:TRINITY_DN15189_c0_g1_i4.p1 TRINITY_DN15189_c0_g1~~TRINITY_DN15189_c0_g1_i4.p1  ORF type:complete len:182 (+),score=49.86 TRINITY_DN15189_c0_g1_i4:3-548(+)
MMLLPLGVVTMRFLPDLFGVSKGTTLSLHMTLFAMVVALQTVGLVAVVPYSSGEHPTHGVTGYICYSLLMVSVALGACSAFKHPLPLTREQVGTTPHRVVGILTAISGAVAAVTGKLALADLGGSTTADAVQYIAFAFHGVFLPSVVVGRIMLTRRTRAALSPPTSPDSAEQLPAQGDTSV